MIMGNPRAREFLKQQVDRADWESICRTLSGRITPLLAALFAVSPTTLLAGMGVPVPTELEVERLPQIRSLSPWIDARLQTLSFFVVGVLLCAAAVRWLWGIVRRDWPALPVLSYRGALAATVLWGLVSVVILTMISGARELMTPGAWKQHGWTYQLADAEPPRTNGSEDVEKDPVRLKKRYDGIVALRDHLWKYAKRHQGEFPDQADLEDPVWTIPTQTGTQYVLLPKRALPKPDTAKIEPLAYEGAGINPSAWSPRHYVLFTSGAIVLVEDEDLMKFLEPGADPSDAFHPLRPFGP